MPEDVQDVFGSALLDVQYGDLPQTARRFGEHVSREVMKLADNDGGNTYRLAYVAYPECIYVLHAFMKKSKSGVGTPQAVKHTVEARLTAAKKSYASKYSTKKKSP